MFKIVKVSVSEKADIGLRLLLWWLESLETRLFIEQFNQYNDINHKIFAVTGKFFHKTASIAETVSKF